MGPRRKRRVRELTRFAPGTRPNSRSSGADPRGADGIGDGTRHVSDGATPVPAPLAGRVAPVDAARDADGADVPGEPTRGAALAKAGGPAPVHPTLQGAEAAEPESPVRAWDPGAKLDKPARPPSPRPAQSDDSWRALRAPLLRSPEKMQQWARWRRRARIAASYGVLLVPMGLLVLDVIVTRQCEAPLVLEYARIRTVWHTTWLVSFLLVGLCMALSFWKLGRPLLTRLGWGCFAAWKAAVILRDRVAMPACSEGWPPGAVPAVEGAFTLAAMLGFVAMVGLASYAARTRRKLA